MAMMPGHVAAFAPGRVNLIGEHTDYNDGLALPFAIDAGVRVDATATGDQTIHAHAVDLDATDTYMLGGESPSPGGWRAFVRGATADHTAIGATFREILQRLADFDGVCAVRGQALFVVKAACRRGMANVV